MAGVIEWQECPNLTHSRGNSLRAKVTASIAQGIFPGILPTPFKAENVSWRSFRLMLKQSKEHETASFGLIASSGYKQTLRPRLLYPQYPARMHHRIGPASKRN